MSGRIVNGRYVVGELIGQGGMGVVYEAEDLLRVERVAIKLMYANDRPDGVAATHLEREGRIGRAIAHPGVVSVIDAGHCDGRPYVAMEYVKGRPLGLVAAEATLSIHQAVTITQRILDGVAAIHRADFVHGDLKTDNVLVDRLDELATVKLIDLGLAVERDRDTRDVKMISGTPDYLAPEVVRGGPKTVASDLYAIGAILYELLTGSTPFGGGSSVEILQRQLDDALIPPSVRCPDLRISIALEHVVMRALDKRPEERYRDAMEFSAALSDACREITEAVLAHEFSARAPTVKWTRPELRAAQQRFAAGTQPPPNRPDPDRLITEALASARAKLDNHRLDAAAAELEAALQAIDAAAPEATGAWRLLLSLSALYDGLGNPRRARDTARDALQRAEQTSSELGCRRAKALLERYAGHGTCNHIRSCRT